MTDYKKLEIFKKNIIMITFGGTKIPGLSRTRITKILNGNEFYYQEERIINNKAGHLNIPREEIETRFEQNMQTDYKNAVIYTDTADFYFRKTKKGSLSVMKREPTKTIENTQSHNKTKKYILPEGESIPFLKELGIMNDEGQVYKKHYSKFRQINRFLELVDDEKGMWNDIKAVQIFDLCCGKGYLTLATHYYFTEILKKNVSIIGMDLKKDVIDFLNGIVGRLDLKGIIFEYGDINEAKIKKADLVVALHACDTATDIALTTAVKARAKVILSVPCCQHELFRQIKNKDMNPILKYGIMKDKFTELSTNALRGLALEAMGYEVKMIEFTSLEHTMKNIMIKAINRNTRNPEALELFENFSEKLNVKSSAKNIIQN